METAILKQVFSDDELENRVRSLLRWKIRFNAVDVAVESGHVTLSGQVISDLDRETADKPSTDCGAWWASQTALLPARPERRWPNGGQKHHH